MARVTSEDVEVMRASYSNANVFTEYYFGVTLLEHQLRAAHAAQNSILTLGGRGSGKSFGYVVVYLWLCTVQADFRVLWTSDTHDHASIAFNEIAVPLIQSSERFLKFLPEGLKSLKRSPRPRINIRVPGVEAPDSYMMFRAAGEGGDSSRGYTFDCIHIDEGGLIYDSRVITTLRPAMRGRRYNGVPRLGRMSCSTTPTAAPWLRHWWRSANDDKYHGHDPANYMAMRVGSAENTYLTEDQLAMIAQDMTAEEVEVEIFAGFPEYLGKDFSPTVVAISEDQSLNRELAGMKARGVAGAEITELSRVGIVRYQKPVVEGHQYVLSGDPGTGNPPHRNAGVVGVVDVTVEPYELVFFDWVVGDGDYRPFFRSYEYAWRYYRSLYSVFDATGTQRAMDQLYFEERGIYVEGLSVTTDKPAMINSLKIFMQKGLLRLPYIEGMHLQLLNYDMGADKKLAQDIVMMLAMAAWKMRVLFYGVLDGFDDGYERELWRDDVGRGVRDRRRVVGRLVPGSLGLNRIGRSEGVR